MNLYIVRIYNTYSHIVTDMLFNQIEIPIGILANLFRCIHIGIHTYIVHMYLVSVLLYKRLVVSYMCHSIKLHLG